MAVNMSDLLGLLVVCIPVLFLIIYSVRSSKKSQRKEAEKAEERGG